MANTSSKTNQTQWNMNTNTQQLSTMESIANAEGDDILTQTSPLLQFDIVMDDEDENGNTSQEDEDGDTSVLSLNLFDVESVFDSDTDSDVCHSIPI